MPEIPDLTVYLDGLRRFAVGGVLERVRLRSAFLLRSFDPPLAAAEQRRILEVSRLGKRLVLHLEDDLFLVLHLMITGRLRWRPAGAKIPGRVGLAAFDVAGGPRGDGTLMLTEVGKKRASLHLVRGEEALAEHDRGGLEVADVDFETFDARLRRNNHTLKRALTDPRIFAGIGNAYSDEILHRARLSPFKTTRHLDAEDAARLFAATREVLSEWSERLRDEIGDGFPDKVTAFRKEMAVHGRFGRPCPSCDDLVQRIIYAENEANYCPGCQTGGRLLADRVLSKLMRDDWPKTLEELEARRERLR